MERDRRLGLVGADAGGSGWGAAAHMPAPRGIEQIELAALCTSRPESAAAAEHAYGAKAFHDIDELVAQPDIDIVSAVVRIPNHDEVVMAAPRAGKHVHCEWPLGATLEETEEIAALARRSGLVTAIGLQGRFDPTLAYVKEPHDRGWLGDVISVDLSRSIKGTPERPSRAQYERGVRMGAHLFDVVGGHTPDRLTYCLGPLARIGARVATRTDRLRMADTGEMVEAMTPDTVLITGELVSAGIVAYRIAEVPFHASGWRLHVSGSKGTVVATTRGLPQITPVVLFGAQGDAPLSELPVPERLQALPGDVPPGPAKNATRAYVRLAKVIREGPAFRPSFEEAADLRRLLDSVQRSSRRIRTMAAQTACTGMRRGGSPRGRSRRAHRSSCRRRTRNPGADRIGDESQDEEREVSRPKPADDALAPHADRGEQERQGDDHGHACGHADLL